MLDVAGHAPTKEEIAQFLSKIPLAGVPAAITVLAARLLGSSAHEADLDPLRDRYLSPDHITDQYGLDRRWVYAHAEQLGAVKLGHRTIRVPESGLLAYLDAQRIRGDRR
jgi:hypothetical protein